MGNFVAVPAACTVLALNVGVNNYFSAAPNTSTVKVYKNSVATSMTCNVTTDGKWFQLFRYNTYLQRGRRRYS